MFWITLVYGLVVGSDTVSYKLKGKPKPFFSIISLAFFFKVVQYFLIPSRYGFTYVQTALLVTVSLVSILKKNKGRFYNLLAFSINLPIGLVSWIEATQCDNFLIHFGGHVWYDTTIPLSFIVYYLIARTMENNSLKQKTE